MKIDLWVYGPLTRYVADDRTSHVNLILELPDGSTMKDILHQVGIPLDEKGITFINHKLSDMPGLMADLERPMCDGDRVAIFHPRSMWPFQYRHDAQAEEELKEAMSRRDGGLHHSYQKHD